MAPREQQGELQFLSQIFMVVKILQNHKLGIECISCFIKKFRAQKLLFFAVKSIYMSLFTYENFDKISNFRKFRAYNSQIINIAYNL